MKSPIIPILNTMRVYQPIYCDRSNIRLHHNVSLLGTSICPGICQSTQSLFAFRRLATDPASISGTLRRRTIHAEWHLRGLKAPSKRARLAMTWGIHCLVSTAQRLSFLHYKYVRIAPAQHALNKTKLRLWQLLHPNKRIFCNGPDCKF